MITCWPSLYRPAEGRTVADRSLIARAKAPRTYANKNDPPGVACAVFRDGYRDLAHFEHAHGTMSDFDVATTRAQIEHAFAYHCGVAYSTWTEGHWRVALFLYRAVALQDEEFGRVQRAVFEIAERAGLSPEHGQSAAHCYAVPSLGGAPYEHVELTGAPFDVDAALVRFPKPEPLPRVEPEVSDPYGHRLERARRYLGKMPGAISGSGGHATTFAAALKMVRGFGALAVAFPESTSRDPRHADRRARV